jgi:hypothetical protein
MTKVVWGAKAAGVIALAFAATSCGKLTREGTSSSYLVINQLQGAAGQNGTFSNVLQSSVRTIESDLGQATFTLALKDSGSSDNPNTPSPNNYVTLTQYHVEYVRSDGRNVQGVDVPYAFDGGLTATVNGSNTSVGFTLVRVQAKQEAPLKALGASGSSTVISTVARVTFYGHDQTGRDVSVTGNIDITFGA